MKNLLLAFMCILTISGPNLFAQSKTDGAKFKFTNGETHDFGKVPKGPVATHEFEFVNTGNQPLIVMDVKPSCACTNVDWDKRPIKPGEKGHITLGVKTDELSGVFNKGVYILSNAIVPNGEKRYTIYLKGEIIEKK